MATRQSGSSTIEIGIKDSLNRKGEGKRKSIYYFSAARIFLLLSLDLAYTELPYCTTLLYLTLALLVQSGQSFSSSVHKALSALYQQSSLDVGDQCLSERFQHSSISTLIKRNLQF